MKINIAARIIPSYHYDWWLLLVDTAIVSKYIITDLFVLSLSILYLSWAYIFKDAHLLAYLLCHDSNTAVSITIRAHAI